MTGHAGLAAVIERVIRLCDSGRQAADAGDFAASDRALKTAYGEADAAWRFTILHRPPSHAAFDPSEALRRYAADMAAAGRRMEWFGDGEQVTACVRLLRDSAQMGAGGRIVTALFGERAAIAVGVDGEGRLAPPFGTPTELWLDEDAFGAAWARATGGGRAERGSHGYTLWLDGDEAIEQGVDAYGEICVLLAGAVNALRPWRAAAGDGEEYLGPDEAARLYAAVIERATGALHETLLRLEA